MFRLDVFKKVCLKGVQHLNRLLGKEAIHHWRTLDKHLADPAAGQEKGPGDPALEPGPLALGIDGE